MEVTEKTKAAYAMLGFGGDNAMLGGMNVRGNIGVRIVRTDIDSVGNVGFPQSSIFTPVLSRPCGTPLRPAEDRKSVVEGKSGSLRVDLGGRRILKKKIKNITTT